MFKMNVTDKINYLLEEKGMSKREFAQKLLSLTPILERTGKTPSESTIYGYLNGGREIKIELIPFIAEALNITEQELFTNEIEYTNDYNYKYSKEAREILDLLKFAPRGAIDEIKNYLMKYKKIYDDGIK
jgi:transcriptional regulator with XRE-family HTH domain